MRIGIVDADLVGRKKHRFPNLACEKISAYWKEKGAEVSLLLNYNDVNEFEEVFISKVFTDTIVPDSICDSQVVHIGGTGFYFDRAPNLPEEIEHHMPDYHLYDDWINNEINNVKLEYEQLGKSLSMSSYMQQFKEYQGYAIGFLTRGCFRKCKFCVNQKYDHVFAHSPLSEFYSGEEKKICLLDDNFLGCPSWRPMLEELTDTGKPFKFKQGLDERLLTEEKCKLLFSANYDGDYTFAFDNIADYELIHSKLQLIRKYAREKESIKFYVLVGFESTDGQDIENAFKRISLLMKYKCLPYIMRYQDKNYSPWKQSRFRGMYIAIARWANQPSIIKKMSFRQFCDANQALCKTPGKVCATMMSMIEFEKEYPAIAKQYFNQRFED
ncbi:hypothetical protein SpiGrapes_2456 [Sphaerochaeta pleomorpha str. Grapes]|uniref:Uncharacterized protein n=1 Tax=Sphaerochaeta pleomorpha (strain ATCC BAA-1885 / DSM 22778 / Grapes) TaxID=158190 RepID=G8QTH8_SPHPG|nr:hypothetical protein [Sphaerochaeta pleomorpha]AEV30219.1 hypothetical protein SpiGrapes_2456 [Sphaerochaeta pleomorpha str. Grapes]